MALQVGELYASFGIDTSGVDKALANIETKFTNLGKNLAITGGAMTLAITRPLVNIGKDIYRTGTEFGEAMSRVFATADLDKAIAADQQAMDALTAKALEMGSTTKFTSAEAAEALNYMAMAGWKTDSMLAGLPPIMNLAAASGEELGIVSDIVTDALTAFGLSAGDAKHFADVLAKTASNANTNVSMLGESFKYAAPMAGAMGYSVEDTAVALGIMANSGIKASQAGTTLRTMMTRMTGTDKKVVAAMNDLNLSMTDASGKMRPLNEVLSDLRESFAGLTEEQQVQYATTLAGRNAVSGFMALVNASEKDFNDLTNAINDSSGAAEHMAKVALDNAAGDLVYLTSAIDGAKVSLWGLVEGPFRGLVQKATQYVTAFNQMDDATKMGVLRTGAFAAAIGPATAALGGLMAALPKVAKGLRLMFTPMGIVSLGLVALGAAAMDTDNSIGKTMENIAATVGEQLGKAADYVSSHTQELTRNAGAFLESLYKSIEDALPNLLQLGADVLVAIMDGISMNVDKIMEIGTSIVGIIREAVVNNVGNIVPAAIQLAQNLIVGIIEAIPTLVDDIGRIAIAIGEALLTADWEGAATGIWTALNKAFESTKDVLANLGEIVKEKFGVDSWEDVAEKIWQGISDAVTSATSWATTIVTNIADGIAGSTLWTDGGGAFARIASSIVNGIASKIPQLFDAAQGLLAAGLKIGNAILSGISTALQGMADEDLGSKLGDAAVQIIHGLLTTITDLNKNGDVDKFMENLKNGMIAAGSILGDALGELVSFLFSADGISAVFNAGKTILKILAEGLTAAVMGVGTLVGNFIDKLLVGLGIVDPAEQEAFRKSGALLSAQIQAGMEEGFEQGSSGFTKTALMAAIAMRNGVNTAFLDGTAYEDVADGLYRAFNSSDAKRSIDDLKKVVEQSLMVWDGSDWIVPDMSGVSDQLWQALYDAVQSKDWQGMMDFLNIGMEDLLPADTGDIQGWAEKEAEIVEQTMNDVKKSAQASMKTVASEGTAAIAAGYEAGKSEVTEAAAGVSSAAVEQFMLSMSAEQGTEIANAFMGAMNLAMVSQGTNLARVANTISSNVLSIFQSTMSSSNGYSIGGNFAAGMQNGIRSGIAGIVSAARESGEAAVQALRNAIQEGSPSKLTTKSGVYFAQGFENGIERSISSVEKAVSNMGAAAVNTLDLASRGYGTSSHARLPAATTTKKVDTPIKDMIKAAAKQTEATNSLASQMADEASYTPKAKAASSSVASSGLSGGSGVVSGSTGMNIGGTDLGGLIETYARLVATALNGVTVELEGEEVGSLVAPVVSTIIAQNAMARSNGTV